MTTDMITLKLDSAFLKQIDAVVKEKNYQNRTEFIRNALREKVEETRLKQAMMEIAHIKGSWRKGKQTTDEEIHRIREQVWNEYENKFK